MAYPARSFDTRMHWNSNRFAHKAYWRLYVACRELDVRREQYKLAQDQFEHAKKKVAAGAAAKTEIVRAEAGLTGRIDALINAETSVQNRQLDLLRIMNRRDIPLNANVRITPKTEPNPLGLDIDEERLVEIAQINLAQATGTLLGYSRIILEPKDIQDLSGIH